MNEDTKTVHSNHFLTLGEDFHRGSPKEGYFDIK